MMKQKECIKLKKDTKENIESQVKTIQIGRFFHLKEGMVSIQYNSKKA